MTTELKLVHPQAAKGKECTKQAAVYNTLAHPFYAQAFVHAIFDVLTEDQQLRALKSLGWKEVK